MTQPLSLPFTFLFVYLLSHVLLFVTPCTVACQFPLIMGFPRQEYWSGLPFPSPVDLPDTGIEPTSPASSALAGGFFTTDLPGKPSSLHIQFHFTAQYSKYSMNYVIYLSCLILFLITLKSSFKKGRFIASSFKPCMSLGIWAFPNIHLPDQYCFIPPFF